LPGPYTLAAGKVGFTRLEYGQSTPFGLANRLSLGEGEVIGNVDFTLNRTGVIRGVVVDESAYDTAGATVRIYRFHYVSGRKRLSSVSNVKPVETNNRGEFVVTDVPPGDYVVAATMPGAFTEFGNVLLGYGQSYAPGTLAAEQAQIVSVLAARDSFARIRLRPVRVVHVSGSVKTSDGRPAQGVARLNGGSAEAPLQVAAIDTDGSFGFDVAVPPGEYELLVSTGGPVVSSAPVEMLKTRLTIGSGKLTELALVTEPGGTIGGNVVSETGVPVTGVPIRVFTYQINSQGEASIGAMSVPVNDRGHFELRDVFWKNVIVTDVNPQSGWQVRGIYFNRQDITDSGLTVRSGQRVEPVSIVLTRNITKIDGQVQDCNGRAMKDCAVFVFADNSEKWRDPLGRYVAVSRPESGGHYSVEGLPSGLYRILALTSAAADQGTDPNMLERLRRQAELVQLSETGRHLVDLKVQSR